MRERILKFSFYFIFLNFYFFFLNSTSKKIVIEIGSDKLLVDLAISVNEKKSGLMFKKKLKDTNGMLFLYDNPDIKHFWMKNTYLHLAIFFIDSNNKVSEFHIGQPLSEKIISSKNKVIAVLEIPSNCLTEVNLNVGDEVFWSEINTYNNNFDKNFLNCAN